MAPCSCTLGQNLALTRTAEHYAQCVHCSLHCVCVCWGRGGRLAGRQKRVMALLRVPPTNGRGERVGRRWEVFRDVQEAAGSRSGEGHFTALPADCKSGGVFIPHAALEEPSFTRISWKHVFGRCIPFSYTRERGQG